MDYMRVPNTVDKQALRQALKYCFVCSGALKTLLRTHNRGLAKLGLILTLDPLWHHGLHAAHAPMASCSLHQLNLRWK